MCVVLEHLQLLSKRSGRRGLQGVVEAESGGSKES